VDAVFLTMSQISTRSGTPLSTTHRLVNELEENGLLERQPDRTYRLGVRLWELASKTPGAVGLREIAKRHLMAVHAKVRQHAQLGILEGRDVLFLERLSTREAVVNFTIIGGRLPLHASSSGLVLLANASAEIQESYLDSELEAYTDTTVARPRELRSLLAKIRKDGYVVGDGFLHPSARGIAVPVRGVHAEAVAAMGLVLPNDAAPPQPFIRLLLAAAAATSRDLLAAYSPDDDSKPKQGEGFRVLTHSSDDSMLQFPGIPREAAKRRLPRLPARSPERSQGGKP
jgi:DNA-binding IclR family transcriptional regulator